MEPKVFIDKLMTKSFKCQKDKKLSEGQKLRNKMYLWQLTSSKSLPLLKFNEVTSEFGHFIELYLWQLTLSKIILEVTIST